MTAAAAATVLGLALVTIGSRSEAESLARELLEDRPVAGSPAGSAAWFVVHWLLGIARYEAGDPPEARAELELGYAAAARFGLDRTFGLGVPDEYLALVWRRHVHSRDLECVGGRPPLRPRCKSDFAAGHGTLSAVARARARGQPGDGLCRPSRRFRSW
jgi:hypothetical protein